MEKCCILVPIYKPELDKDEISSIKQLFKVLGSYKIYAICPMSLDVEWYWKNFKFTSFFRFFDKYFTDYPKGYNSLMLEPSFYDNFEDFEYALIYQPDCWVFRDELEYWCNKGYDYIGAPYMYFQNITKYFLRSKCCVGNGGFSLRKISWFSKTLKQYEFVKDYILFLNNEDIGEDRIFRYLSEFGIDNFNLPDYREACAFSFEDYPQINYEINNYKLPFGCHKYKGCKGKEFWDDFILEEGTKKYTYITWSFEDDPLYEPEEIDELAEYICITDKEIDSNVWKLQKLNEEYDNKSIFEKRIIAKYTSLDYINTKFCVRVSPYVRIKASYYPQILENFSTCYLNGLIFSSKESIKQQVKNQMTPYEKSKYQIYCKHHEYNPDVDPISSDIIIQLKDESNIKFNYFIMLELLGMKIEHEDMFLTQMYVNKFIDPNSICFLPISNSIFNSSYFYDERKDLSEINSKELELINVKEYRYACKYIK